MTLFPYTTLFRSENADAKAESEALEEIENEDHGAMPIGEESEECQDELKEEA